MRIARGSSPRVLIPRVSILSYEEVMHLLVPAPRCKPMHQKHLQSLSPMKNSDLMGVIKLSCLIYVRKVSSPRTCFKSFILYIALSTSGTFCTSEEPLQRAICMSMYVSSDKLDTTL